MNLHFGRGWRRRMERARRKGVKYFSRLRSTALILCFPSSHLQKPLNDDVVDARPREFTQLSSNQFK